MPHLHERSFLLALGRIFFHDPKTGVDLINAVGDISCLFTKDRSAFREFFGGKVELFEKFSKFDDWKLIERDLKKAEELKVNIIGITDAAYPKLLKEIFDPPVVIFLRGGRIEILDAPSVAIVGSRKAGEHSRHLAADVAEKVSQSGFAVTSGMAIGIDSAAHAGALFGMGGTIAVMGCGPEFIYPPSGGNLHKRILDDGIVITEFPFGEEPYPSNFPQRNRIISGLSVGTVIVSAEERSGSLITARLAAEQGREVMSVPGLAGSVMSRGTNALIKNGAHLVESGADVLSVLAKHLPKIFPAEKTGLFENNIDKDSPILNVLSKKEAVPVDEIIMRTGLSVTEVLQGLSTLAVEGKVVELDGRRFRLGK